ncbi:1,2-phenylacetyl-CoA epoxidase subunit PaaD [Bordetella genomosp. 11]|uniref:Phenylacetate-CoA oxygenase subunit PaaJ n=1 Tax=Bordetella genomosp. 11 TaxID=1416808 RepID=A0A261UIR1_9BORD|nr:1,2-phenylacetyl-CoA epoxidase subunit PaaD [Bordetella genomosp. 11]OZI61501.1 phenylacetate-CoA oxygenase subunit PaaJ [Bordetella genomosp. 11]
MVAPVLPQAQAPASRIAPECIARWLDAVRDPEMPALSVTDLGIVRDIAWEGPDAAPVCVVTITPTYSGCPAMREITQDIEWVLRGHGIPAVSVRTRLAPAWTTDWLSERGRRALLAEGIAPPAQRAIDVSGIARRAAPAVACPHCGSMDTRMLSGFGATSCRALYRCNGCREPFDYFKSH